MKVTFHIECDNAQEASNVANALCVALGGNNALTPLIEEKSVADLGELSNLKTTPVEKKTRTSKSDANAAAFTALPNAEPAKVIEPALAEKPAEPADHGFKKFTDFRGYAVEAKQNRGLTDQQILEILEEYGTKKLTFFEDKPELWGELKDKLEAKLAGK